MAVTRQDVIDRLSQLGYEAEESDNEMLDFELLKYTNYTLNYCNITSVPEIVEPRLIDRICAEFLLLMKDSGKLGQSGFNFETAVKKIKEGDTTIDYSIGAGEKTPESRFDDMLKALERGYDKWLTPFRRLRW